ncbi:Auxin-responsive protein IAA7 [Platanthera guangdongensis]|uniref:Auxin-responsive protein n=1 Tax=Platanthera guangdongensis TaxID=2320717 RepID=A0ABR2N2F4_9ASPA
MDKNLRKERCFIRANEERELELRLGPPGEDWAELKGKIQTERVCHTALSLNQFSNVPTHMAMAGQLSSGTKRGFYDRIEPHTEAFQQQEQSSFRHLQTKPELEKENLERTNGRLEQHQSAEVKTCCLPPIKSSQNRSQIRSSSSTPVVGWPPIRSSRKNLATSSKLAVESKPESSEREGKRERKGFFVKINMEGIPIGRKIDLLAYDCYEKLSSAVDELFRDLLAVQMNPLTACKKNEDEPRLITGLLDGSGEYTLVYEDDEGDKMLVGDVPWDMFVSTAKRLRVLKTSDLSSSSTLSMDAFCGKKHPT